MTGGGLQLSRHGSALPFATLWWELDSERVTGPGRERPDWIVVEESPLRHYSPDPEGLKPVLDEYDLKRTIHAVDLDRPYVYDQQDAFYLPLDGLATIIRPGPNFSIYARRGR